MVSSGYGRAPHTIAQLHLNIDPRWDKPGDLVTATGFDETLHPVLENLGRIVWARGFFLILVFICCVTEVKLSLITESCWLWR